MQTVGLITFHFAHHYGAQLQAYASMEAIRRLGAHCQIIDYRLPHTTRTNRIWKEGHSPKALMSNLHTALHRSAFLRRFQRFEAFVAEEMELSPRRYTTLEELRQDPPVYDVYAAGSDQIWNPTIYENQRFDPAFFLSFAQGRKIAYAPSFGLPELPEAMGDELRGYLSDFAVLSAREQSGADILEQVSGREARSVLDPTLLLNAEDWSSVAAAPTVQGPYILCYFISDPSAVLPYVRRIQRETCYPIVQLAGMRKRIEGAGTIVYDAGPKEFLGLFQNAAYVCTNSFHGTVFSLQFEKPFFTTMSPKELARPQASRIYNLLSRLGLEDRIIGLPHTAEPMTPVDYAAAAPRLEQQRSAALAFLQAAVEGTPLPSATEDSSLEKHPELCPAADCTGCSACQNACPRGCLFLEPDGEGFLRPVFSHGCVGCSLCRKACPRLHPLSRTPATEAIALWNRDEDVRMRSTSGGFFSILANYILDWGGAVYGAAFDEDMILRHRRITDPAGLAALRGAKYVQSDLGLCYRRIRDDLEEGNWVLFSGTPCQVDGLYRILNKDYPTLLTCDLVCHGVPSPGVFADSLAALERELGGRIADLAFRDKTQGGWQKSSLTATLENGRVHSQPLMETEFGRGFGSALFLRPSCHSCPYASTHRMGDFTLGDFWGLTAEAMPAHGDKGVSLVLLNSQKARDLFPQLQESFEAVERPLQEAVAGNPRLASPIDASPKRTSFFSARRALPFDEVRKTYLKLPSGPYRLAAKVLSPAMKARLRKLMG